MEWLNVFATAFTAVTALFAALITWWQYQLSRRQFRHELYDRRLKVFHATQAYFADMTRRGTTGFLQCVQLRAETAEAEYLFGDEVVQLLESLFQQGLELAGCQEQLYPENGDQGLPKGDERTRVANRKHELLRKLMADDFGRTRAAFKRYLTIE